MKILRDPIHGDIEISRELISLVDTPEFQRLRGVKMLGTAYLVYPGATHTRFEHSLGTYWLTNRLLNQLFPEGLDSKLRLAVQAAALLHDVTHIPFGHTFEDERRIFERHDHPDRLRRFLPVGRLGAGLEKLGILDEVLDILTERHPQSWTYEVFSGTVCGDLLDYLARDATYCGLPQRYDPRVFRYFIRRDSEICLEAHRQGLLREDVVSEIVHLLRLRYFLSERVYFHHSKTASGAMISRAVEEAVTEGLTLEQLNRLTDERLLALLENDFGKLPVVSRLLEHLKSHRIYKRAYVLTRAIGDERRTDFVRRFHLDPQQRSQAESHLSKKLKLKPGELVVYCPASKMQLKEAEVKLLVDPNEPPRSMAEMSIPEITVLQEKHRDLWKFYVFVAPRLAEKLPDISQACEEYFHQANHLPGLQTGQLYLGI